MNTPSLLALCASCAALAGLATACGGNTVTTAPALKADAGAGEAGSAKKPAAMGSSGAYASRPGRFPAASAVPYGSAGGPGGVAGGVAPGVARGVAPGVAGAGAGAAAPTPTPATGIRFANLVADAAAGGYDLCTASPGDLTWNGPMLGGAIRFAQVSRFVAMGAGSYDARVVAAGATDCSKPVATGLGLPALAANKHITYALVGTITPMGMDPSASLVGFVDDASAAGGQAAVRFVNASPAAQAVDFGIEQGGSFAPMAQDVLFGQAATLVADGGLPDTNGYLLTAPLVMATLGARSFGATTDLVTATNITLAGGSVSTIIAVNGGSDGATPQLLLCQDNAPTQGMLSACAFAR